MHQAAVRFAESAITDLQAIKNWYIDKGVPDVGDRLVKAIIAAIETLRAHPELGRIVPEFDRPFLRELIHPPFRIVYRLEPKLVQIVRVWRSERLLPRLGDADE